ncbi:MAG TPA: hypothetical protein V6C91_14680 [Coleofasciculaceae cyanobacterium]
MANSPHTYILHLAVETAAIQTKPAYRAMLLRTLAIASKASVCYAERCA